MPMSANPPDPAVLLAAARAELAQTADVLERLLSGLDAAAWRARPAPAEWSPVEIVCHLRDEEVEDFGARLRVVVEGEAAFVPIDPERWAVERRYRDADGPAMLAAFRERREASLLYLAGLAPARLGRAVPHARTTALSGVDLLAAWVAHDRMHLAQLTATLTRLWAERWAPARSDYAGPIPYPPAAPTPTTMGERRIKYLDMLQAVITRMAGNQFSLRAWSVALGTAVIGYAASRDGRLAAAFLAALPAAVFWISDAYYLALERKFRGIFAVESQVQDNAPSFSFETNVGVADVEAAAKRPAVWLAHGPVLLLALLVGFLSFLR
jgi:hypothetical protein